MKLGLVPLSPWQHQVGWSTGPAEYVERVMDPTLFAELAVDCDRAGIDFLFLPDKQVGNATPADPSMMDTWLEPLTLMSYLAAVTEHIGVVPTLSTTWFEPYPLARWILSLDHLSGGRAGWNAVSSHQGLEQRSFAHREELSREDAKARHVEFVSLVSKLWKTWDPEAIIADAAEGKYTRSGLVHEIHHAGRFFDVEGHLNVAASPQGAPVIAMAGKSESFMRTAAATADIVFTMENSTTASSALAVTLRCAEAEVGGGRTLLMPGLTVDLVGGASSSTGHFHVAGDPRQVAEEMVRIAREGSLDGFIVLPQSLPDDIRIFASEVVPELRRLGVRDKEPTPGATLRERLALA